MYIQHVYNGNVHNGRYEGSFAASDKHIGKSSHFNIKVNDSVSFTMYLSYNSVTAVTQ